MKCLILIVVFLISISSKAQDCTEEFLLQKPGIWQETSGSVSGITSADLAREKKVESSLHSMIKSKYSPMGVNIKFGGAYSNPSSYMPANSYYYHIMAFDFYCDGNTIKTDDETSTTFQISANGFDAEIYDTAQGDRSLAEGFNVMHDLPVEKDGYWYFNEKDVNLGFGMTGKTKSWLITYDGKLPYSYVSKKEFLEKRKINLTTSMLDAARGFKDALKNLEMEKGLMEKEYKNDPEKLAKYMKGYNYTKDKYEKFLADNEENYKPEFDKIETLLNMSIEELNQHAIVKLDPNANLSSYLFTDENDPFGEILIKPNPGYFNKKLPRSAPQFFWINVIWNHNDPIATRFSEDIMKAIDFGTLKSMLGK
ncbi:MAG: hypothetical protein WC780_14430 [Lentimicrobiaceae bacterium]|jgi:hypothetical protein